MLTKVFPFLSWVKGYNGESFRLDAVAGLTVALVLIPQSMAYAQLANLPPYYGLYAAFLPPILGSLFGSSRQLATGPVAVVSLMTGVSLLPLAQVGSDAFVFYAILLALLVGAVQLTLGLLRLGMVVNFLSHPVVNGFTSAGAIVIVCSQLGNLFGVNVDASEHQYETTWLTFKAAYRFMHWPTLFMGLIAFAIMFTLRKINRRIPNVLVAVAVTTAISYFIGFEHDAKVKIEDIHSEEVVRSLATFNQVSAAIPKLSAQRTDMLIKERELKAKGRSEELFDLQHEIVVAGYKSDELKETQHLTREHLRELFLAGAPRAGGGMDFYEKDQVPQGAQTDGRTWRLKVGNQPIDTAAIRLIGGGAVVGVIPKGLPSFAMPKFDVAAVLELLPMALLISMLGFMEAISIAKGMAAKTGQQLDPNQELIGQGLANILGSFTKSYPASGSFSRSAVNFQAGAVSGFSSVFTSLSVIITLLFLTPTLYHLPQSVLAAVIMMAVFGLVNVSGIVHAFKAQWYDGAIALVCVALTLYYAPHLDKGIMTGVVLSLAVYLYKSMRPKIDTLSLAPDRFYRDAKHYKLKECKHIAFIRFDGALFFANASYLEDQVIERLQNMPELRAILLDCRGLYDMDASGEDALSLSIDRARGAGVDIYLSGVKDNILEVMKRTHLLAKIGVDHIFADEAAAVCALHAKTHADSAEENCPLVNVCPLPVA
jgi:MFS superfamily sulfate permease-like transporter